MICRVAIHEQTPGSIASDEARSFREWIKEQPGFVGGYHAQDSQTLKSVSITVWASKESMMALRDRTPPGVRWGSQRIGKRYTMWWRNFRVGPFIHQIA
jgi:heme-degrading monooxygenase HmoA